MDKEKLVTANEDVQKELNKAGLLIKDAAENFNQLVLKADDNEMNLYHQYRYCNKTLKKANEIIYNTATLFDQLAEDEVVEQDELTEFLIDVEISDDDYTISGEEGICYGETEVYVVHKDYGTVVEWNLTNNNSTFILKVLDNNSNRCEVTCIDDDNYRIAETEILTAKLDNGEVHTLEIMNIGTMPTDEEIKGFSKETNK